MKQYLDLLRTIIETGDTRKDRTGVGTKSIFGATMRFDLRCGYPAVTTKKLNFKPMAQELAWFLRGETNVKTLGNGIWDAWAREDGECGPIYPAQWRRWAGHYDEQGGRHRHDQIADLVRGLQLSPHSRRHIVSAWNVADLHLMALPPCHVMFQCYVGGESDEFLDMSLAQRSADLALGIPFNIASYSLLLSILAQQLGKTPRYFVHNIGDAHVYINHMDGIKEQLTREPLPLPRLRLDQNATVDNFVDSMAGLEDYRHHPAIKFEVAV